MATTKGLGKGLGALLGNAALQNESEGTLQVPIAEVQPTVDQPRKAFEPEALEQLADSIRNHGIIQPLTVRRLSTGLYQIIAGERRWRAAKMAGLTTVPVVVLEADDRQVAELALIENLQREDLNPIEEAEGYKSLMNDYNLTQEQVSEQLGRPRSSVANALRLLDLPDAVRSLLENGTLSAGHAKVLLGSDDPSVQREVASKIIKEGLSVRKTEALIKQLSKKKNGSAEREDGGVYQEKIYREDAERKLTEKLGRKVSIHPGARKGDVVLEYYDTDDLNALLEQLNQIKI